MNALHNLPELSDLINLDSCSSIHRVFSWMCHDRKRNFLIIIVLLLLACNEDTMVWCRRRSSRSSRRQHPKAPGPNMCRVQHVVGSRDKFYTHCVAKHLKYICDRPTYVRWECCSGFSKKGRDKGCTKVVPLDNLYGLSQNLKLETFLDHVDESGLKQDLTTHGPYTVFAPIDEAFDLMSLKAQSDLHPTDGSPPQMMYHIAPGRLNVSMFRQKNQKFVTLHGGDRVRVNKYAYGVATVNCARIIRPDELATNGIIHVIDKVINPRDMESTIAQKIEDDERFSRFNMALLVSALGKRLRDEKRSFTILAPTNEAFDKLPSHILERMFTDSDTAEKILKRHVVRGVYCADAIVVAVGLKTMDDARLLFRCKRDSLRINEADVVHPDIVASNGVIHGVDTVFLPDSVKSTTELLQDMRLNKFVELMEEAGLKETVTKQKNITIFTPSDKAIAKLPPLYLAEMMAEPMKMKRLLQHHMVEGHLTQSELVGGAQLNTMADFGVKIRINTLRAGMLVDKAALSEHPRECENAVIHEVDGVLVPPESGLVDTILDKRHLSVFGELLVKSGLAKALSPTGSFTIIAPTDRAFSYINQKQLNDIKKDEHRLKMFVARHIIPTMVLKCSVPDTGVYTFRSMQFDESIFFYDKRDRLHVGQHSKVLGEDTLTSNGVLYVVDHVMPCSCERSLRNRYGQYISSYRYRKPYA